VSRLVPGDVVRVVPRARAYAVPGRLFERVGAGVPRHFRPSRATFWLHDILLVVAVDGGDALLMARDGRLGWDQGDHEWEVVG